MHEQRVLGLDVRRRLQPRGEGVGERADWQQLQPLRQRPRGSAQLLSIGLRLLEQRLWVGVDDAHAQGQRRGKVGQLRLRGRHRVLGPYHDGDVAGERLVQHEWVPRLDGARHARREDVAGEAQHQVALGGGEHGD